MKEAKTLFFFLAGVALLIVILGMLNNRSQGKPLIPGSQFGQEDTVRLDYVKIAVGDKQVDVRLADDPTERRIGLSQTSALSDDEGMLFVLDPADSKPAFWMMDM
jgi:hypothetical protein